MKAKHLLLITLPIALVSCKNPADETTSATVTEAVTPAATDPAEPTAGVRYALQPGSEILFVGSKVTGSHEGGFKTLAGSFSVADGKLVGTGQKITIDMNSVWSDNDNLTGHLKNEDFFHVEKYPESVFELTSLTTTGEGTYEVSGNLTLTGTTKNITFPATATVDGETANIHAKFDINRKDFGIEYAGKADDLIRDEVVIELKLQAAPDAASDT
jgi:polyisoprenoid-binding protein YceI